MENDVSESCWGCKFLYGDGDGYSDWTWMGTSVTCALGLNNDLPTEHLYETEDSELAQVIAGRCDRYSKGAYIVISPDGEPEDAFDDPEQEAAIRADTFVQDA